MKKNFKYLGILFILVLNACSLNWTKNIKEIDSLKQVQKKLDKVDNNTVVVFDVDDTLTYDINIPLQKWFMQSDIGEKFWKDVNSYIDTKQDPKKYSDLVFTKAKLTFVIQPVENILTITTIKNLQKRGIKVIALTHCITGGVGLISSYPRWRWEKLHEVGIDFSSSFDQEEIILDALNSPNGHPVFFKGILLTDYIPKGQVFGAFLDVIGWKPSKVIFFDDSEKQINSVREEMKKRQISFLGYIYKAVQKLPHKFDQAVLAKQLQYIKEHDEFISDEKARTLL